MLGWVLWNRQTLGATGLHDRLDELEEGVALILKALLAKLEHLEDLVPSVNLTHNANPLAPLFEALLSRFSGNVQNPQASRDESGQFNGTPENQIESTSEI